MQLSVAQLGGEKSEPIKNLLAISFEYLLARVASIICDTNKWDDIQSFNRLNKLSIPKILSYPFFIALANGHSKSLYALFGEFYSFTQGPLSMSIFELIYVNKKFTGEKLNYFNVGQDDNPVGVVIKGNFSLSQILENLLKTELDINGHKVIFSDVKIISDNDKSKELFSAIDAGIAAIQNQSNNSFFNSELDVIKLHASYFGILEDRFSKNDVSIIEYGDIESLHRRPFYSET